ncbi:hypothetical protein PsorP6_004817 [Peronosclerospora sorghi]|uniref:Uncharacterized protein n=1 Tax=Peronosclerospora sorghi TaxID=230839 RepID=A0ACC0VMT0_9STRA|nr:hypothetical protein PsorP6_004817 [Peronosclerospora sorghi]
MRHALPRKTAYYSLQCARKNIYVLIHLVEPSAAHSTEDVPRDRAEIRCKLTQKSSTMRNARNAAPPSDQNSPYSDLVQ